jgi:hypothetical protein
LGLTSPVTAQNTVTTVTFTMPVNLTQLSPDLGKVRMACVISPNLLLVYDRNFNLAISSFDFDALPRDELPVVSGQLAATLRVVSAIDAGWLKGDPAGSTWQYECRLQGYSTSSQGWGDFSATPKSPALTLNPAPAPVRGSFTW